ncbi:uncharacterized protein LY89DRAFT_783888 [Mollisia scopiformis]|uniref:Serine hydrolase domain-containing protein n=1 Tax=Mollisia scopiformis TaxID=149040 RepID=A0A194X3R2_MOLSC|nr:uncharacterized protein LY89DRAFT_783888 [Mollisia scopiformis]KUJ14806.1 hypothetical protein LY89DRAFT_783888 [Mollisia scopiformis]
MSKLRILCLHGFTSNGNVHKHQVRNITSQFSSEFEFIFPDGPYKVDLADGSPSELAKIRLWIDFVAANSTSGHRAWWFAKDPNPATNDLGGFQGLEKSLEYIGRLIEKSGPVHAIWGFSQGACFAGFLTSLLHEKQRGHHLRQHLPQQQGLPRVGVYFSGFKARFAQYDSVYEHGIEVPTLHIMGEQDHVVRIERSETLKSVCRDPRTLKHGGGHNIPESEEDMAIVANFLREALESKSRESL